jgi:hypothetical protein
MPDHLLKIRTELEAAKTVKELEALRREITNVRKQEVLGTQDYVQAAKLEVDIKNRLHGANTQAYSDNAKMKESYFTLGEELRRFYQQQRVGDRTMNEVGGTFNSFGINVSNVTQILQQAEFTVNAVGMVATRAGGGIGALGAAITSMAMPLTIAVAGLAAYAAGIKALYDNAQKAVEFHEQAMAKIAKTPGEKIDAARTARNRSARTASWSRAMTGGIMNSPAGWGVAVGGALTGQWDMFGANIDADKAMIAEEEYQDAILAGFVGPMAPSAAETGAAQSKSAEERRKAAEEYIQNLTRKKDRASKPRPFLFAPVGGLGGRQWGVKETEPKDILKAGSVDWSPLERGAMRLGGILQDELSSAFTMSFNLGDSLLGRLGTRMLDLLGNYLIGSLLSFIPGIGPLLGAGTKKMAGGGYITEPVFGIGLRTGTKHFFGEDGPERVSPMRGASGSLDPLVREIRGLRTALLGGNWVELNTAMARSNRRTRRVSF